jgi:hypothetical protein
MFYGTATTLSGTEVKDRLRLAAAGLHGRCVAAAGSPVADAKTAPSDGSVPSGSTTCHVRSDAIASGADAAHACVIRHDSLFRSVSGDSTAQRRGIATRPAACHENGARANMCTSKLHASNRNRHDGGNGGDSGPFRGTRPEGTRFAAFVVMSGTHNSPCVVHGHLLRCSPSACPGPAAEPRIARRNRSRQRRGISKLDLH